MAKIYKNDNKNVFCFLYTTSYFDIRIRGPGSGALLNG